MAPYRVLVLPDIHVPDHDVKTLAAVLRYAKDFKCDEIIQIGDFMDFNCISSHNKSDLRAVRHQTIQKDYKTGNEVLDKIQTACGSAKFTLLEGNHDYRIERYISEFPALEGSLEMARGLRLEDRKINWLRYWSQGTTYSVGNATFGHGIYVNDHHAKKHVQAYGTNFFYGHVHDTQCFSMSVHGKKKMLIAQSLGCLQQLNPAWLRGRPHKWQQAFATFYFQPNGFFNYYVTHMFNHSFVSPEGEFYAA